MKTANRWIIVDLDGTLCDNRHRAHIAERARGVESRAPWSEFHDRMFDDTPHDDECALVRLVYHQVGVSVAYITGRPESHRGDVLAWLKRHNLPVDDADASQHVRLYMRPVNTYAPSAEYKARMLEVLVRHATTLSGGVAPTFWFALEDDDACVAMYRRHNITTLQPRHATY